MNEWISVCDDIPQAGVLVKIRGRIDPFDGTRLNTVARLSYDGGTIVWTCEDGAIPGETVTEWSPIPARRTAEQIAARWGGVLKKLAE